RQRQESRGRADREHLPGPLRRGDLRRREGQRLAGERGLSVAVRLRRDDSEDRDPPAAVDAQCGRASKGRRPAGAGRDDDGIGRREMIRSKTTLVLFFAAAAAAALAQEKAKSDAAPPVTPSPGTPSVLPRPDFHFPGKVGRTYLDSDPPQFPQPVQAPKGAPNVVLILIDDAGFGQFSTFGGLVPSPTMDRLAAEGLRYNRFHTTALCSPTRAALITGRNHHSAATGVIGEAATGYDGYTSILPRSAGTVGEVLRANGYMTAWIGKNHNTPTWEAGPAGP